MSNKVFEASHTNNEASEFSLLMEMQQAIQALQRHLSNKEPISDLDTLKALGFMLYAHTQELRRKRPAGPLFKVAILNGMATRENTTGQIARTNIFHADQVAVLPTKKSYASKMEIVFIDETDDSIIRIGNNHFNLLPTTGSSE
ncbi:MAG: hypothetical protein WDZ81_00760 [Candidatus Saccharimonadales bacterium]